MSETFFFHIEITAVNSFSTEIIRNGNKQRVTMNVNIIAPPNRKYFAWIVRSMLASFSTFSEMYITSNDYENYDPSIVHQKCF